MATTLNRNFKVTGNVTNLYQAASPRSRQVAGLEVQLWHRAPLQRVFLGSGITEANGDFTIEFGLESPSPYVVDGQIKNTFVEVYYNGEKLELDTSPLLHGLVSYWKFDESSGTSAADATGRGHTGALAGIDVPTWGPGLIHNGLVFDGGETGGNMAYITVPASEDFDFGTGDFTWSMWITHANSAGFIMLLDTGYPNTNSILLQYWINHYFSIYHDGDNLVYTGTCVLYAYAWYHIVVRRINGVLEMFLNNASLGTASFTGSVQMPNDLVMGAWTGGPMTLNGTMDEVAVWKGRGLSNDEIATLYNEGQGLQFPFSNG